MKSPLLFLRRSLTALCLVLPASSLAQEGDAPETPGQTPGQPQPQAAGKAPEADFPPANKVLEGFRKIVSTSDGAPGLYTLYVRDKDQQIYAEVPKDFAKQRHFIALTVASGEAYAGLQAGDYYVYWRQFDKRLALVQPNLEMRSTGDQESKDSVQRLFTDRVLLDVPIVTVIPKGGPVIDLDALLVEQASKFFGPQANGIQKLFTLKTVKSFPQNIEVGIEVPMANGQLRTLHYSISNIVANKEYKPRVADERVGYFVTNYNDLGKFEEDQTAVRYINRWHLEKADPSLKLSPPKEPIVFYIEHTTPVRYRRWVADGLLMWNDAFERVGLVNAIEVRFQDSKSGAHMDKDPEDVRHNFIRWLSNGAGTAIGPSRTNPETGQILDADIILTDGWIRHWWTQYNKLLPQLAMEGFDAQTLSWLEEHPEWDPRLRLASPVEREQILADRAQQQGRSLGGHPLASLDSTLLGDQEFDGLSGRVSQVNGLCMAANCKTHGLAAMRMQLDILAAEQGEAESGEGDGKKEDEQVIDGIPEAFIGPLLADLVAHEVGHTLGLRHNFKGSSILGLEEINSESTKGARPFAGSVMDYLPVNIRVAAGACQGDYAMVGIGPYDIWAIEYGYSFENDLKPILQRSSEKELRFATDEDTWGPDPLARRYDFSSDPLEYARDQMMLVKELRSKLLDKYVKDGDTWARARRGYLLTLATQLNSVSMMANWVGGAHVYRHKKGDPNSGAPIEVVPADQQRRALAFVVENALDSNSFGLTPEILQYLTIDKWWDAGNMSEDPTWPVHDRILGIQASALTAVMNPTTLQRIYDNEFRLPPDQDALTLPELLDTLSAAVWKQLDGLDAGMTFTARKPLIQSFDRNLQREYLERLTDLVLTSSSFTAAYKPISDLANMNLREIQRRIDAVKEHDGLDPYSRSHLQESSRRIAKALEAGLILEARNR
ncbi:MAG TPA: zinc-dependent metalloprotease [Verrucomicrobiales bacterium]|nr:zinc-dependent metalloprotease [Verrucomicrobiales bacterium]